MSEAWMRKKKCGAKARLTKEQAEDRAKGIMHNDPGNGTVKAYECPYCHYWHVGRLRDWDGLDKSRKDHH